MIQLTRNEIIAVSSIAVSSALLGGLVGFFSKKRNAPPSKRAVVKAATPSEPVVLSEDQRRVQTEFDKAYAATTREVAFNRKWLSENGYMNGLLHSGITEVGTYRSKAPDGRRVLISVAGSGTSTAVYQRWIGDNSTFETISSIDGKTEASGVRTVLESFQTAQEPTEKTVQ